MVGRGSLFLRLLAAVLLIGALVAAGWMIFQAGQAQGYAMGAAQAAAQAGDAGGVQPVPQGGPFYPGYYGYYRPHFSPFFPLAGIFWFLVLFFVIGGLFRAIFWGLRGPRHYGWYGGPGHHHPHGWWGGPPPAEGGAPERGAPERKVEEH